MFGIDLAELIKTLGYIGLFGVIFAESGLLIGFFLPGDSVLFTAGFLASQGYFSPLTLIVLCFMAAVAGDSVGYTFGKKFGPKLFNKENSLLFHKDHLQKAQDFYNKHGGKTIVMARFMPVVRTFAPIVAGAGKMTYSNFITFNVIGGALWAIGVPLAGYYLGKSIPNVDHYLLPIVALIIIVSVAPGMYHLLKDKDTRTKLWATIRQDRKILKTVADPDNPTDQNLP